MKEMFKKLQKSKKGVRYLFSGVMATVIDYVVYETLAMTVLGGALGVASSISAAVATFAAYFLHSRLTWVDKDPGRAGVAKFFLWNIIVMITIRPFIVEFFASLNWIYDCAYFVSTWLRLPFSYDFVVSTGTYGLTAVVTMTLSYLFYNKIVFTNTKPTVKNKRKPAK